MVSGERERVHWNQNRLKTLSSTIEKHIFVLNFFRVKNIKKTADNNTLR